MSQTDLINQLKQLHDHLPDKTPEEAQHRQVIGELLENIESRDLGHDNFDQLSDVADTIKMLLIEYEDRHPAVTGILRSLGNTLSGMGI